MLGEIGTPCITLRFQNILRYYKVEHRFIVTGNIMQTKSIYTNHMKQELLTAAAMLGTLQYSME